MSDAVESRLQNLLEETGVDPYGNPIPLPGSDDPRGTSAANSGLVSLKKWLAKKNLADGGSREVTLVRIAEAVQTDPGLLASFQQAGILPGARLQVTKRGKGVRAGVPGGDDIELTVFDQAHLFVK